MLNLTTSTRCTTKTGHWLVALGWLTALAVARDSARADLFGCRILEWTDVAWQSWQLIGDVISCSAGRRRGLAMPDRGAVFRSAR